MSDEKPNDDVKKDDDEKWSQAQQKADQAEANYRKKAEENSDLLVQLSAKDEKLAALEKRVADIADSQEIPIEDLLDPDLVDAKTIKTVSKLAKESRAQKKELDKLKKLAEGIKAKEQENKAASEKDKTVNEILASCDKEFGAKFRNAAKKMADALVDDGNEPQPKTIVKAMDLLRRCYREVKAKAEEKGVEKKAKVQTDNGKSSFAVDASVPKAGSRTEILASMRKTGLNLLGKS